MQWRNTSNSYGTVARLLHWGTLVLIIAQYVLAETAEELEDGPEKFATLGNHMSIGILILLLTLVRIGWKLANRGLPLPVAMVRPQQIAAASGEYAVNFFGFFDLPPLVGSNHDLHEALEEVHETLFNALFVVAVLHALAAVYHHVWMKDDSLRRMLPFGKPRA